MAERAVLACMLFIGDSMNESQFEEFISGCVAEAQRKNDALDAEHGLHSFARWDDRTGMRIFTDAHVDCDEYLAWELAAASVNQLGSLGCYREPVGHLWVFVSIDEIAAIRRAT